MNELKLFDYIYKLKNTKRKGWTRFIDDVESVADHSYGVSLLSYFIGSKLNIDVNKILKLGLIHDLSESIVGDITPHENMNEKQKKELEIKAITKISNEINFIELKELFIEYENQETKEAILVKDIDKLEMCMQALNYERDHNIDLTEFFIYSEKLLNLDESKKIFQEIIGERKVKKNKS
jgi:putative hydrolases of HD superfamily